MFYIKATIIYIIQQVWLTLLFAIVPFPRILCVGLYFLREALPILCAEAPAYGWPEWQKKIIGQETFLLQS